MACGQGTFQNLDFEQAVIQPLPGDGIFLEWSVAVPGWDSGQGYVYYRQGHLGVSPIYLLRDSTSPEWAPGTQLAGNFSLSFASGFAGNDPSTPWLNVGITQSGFISSSSRSIRMLATGPFKLLVDGVQIPMFSLGDNSYGGDISSFAGSTARLTIVNTASVWEVHRYSIVDNIEFSPEVIPEPGTGVFLPVLGLLVLLRRQTATMN